MSAAGDFPSAGSPAQPSTAAAVKANSVKNDPATPEKKENGPSPDSAKIAWAFLTQYYSFLNKDPSRLHCFYTKRSTLIHSTEGEDATACYGQREIHEKIMSLGFNDCKVYISQVDSQSSADGGIIVQVIGEIANPNWRKFAQTFFLAEQPNGYFVLNDICRYMKEEGDDDLAASSPVPAAAAAVPQSRDSPVIQQQQQPPLNAFAAPGGPTSDSARNHINNEQQPQHLAHPTFTPSGDFTSMDAPQMQEAVQSASVPSFNPAEESTRAVGESGKNTVSTPRVNGHSANSQQQQQLEAAPEVLPSVSEPTPSATATKIEEPVKPDQTQERSKIVPDETKIVRADAPTEQAKPVPGPAPSAAQNAPTSAVRSPQQSSAATPVAAPASTAPSSVPSSPPSSQAKAPSAPKSWASLAAAGAQAGAQKPAAWGHTPTRSSATPVASSSTASSVTGAAAAAAAPHERSASSKGAALEGAASSSTASAGSATTTKYHPSVMSITTSSCFVKGVHEGVNVDLLQKTLEEKYGPVQSLDHIKAKACAFVDFKNVDSARRAIQASLRTSEGGEGGLMIDSGGPDGADVLHLVQRKPHGERPESRPHSGKPSLATQRRMQAEAAGHDSTTNASPSSTATAAGSEGSRKQQQQASTTGASQQQQQQRNGASGGSKSTSGSTGNSSRSGGKSGPRGQQR